VFGASVGAAVWSLWGFEFQVAGPEGLGGIECQLGLFEDLRGMDYWRLSEGFWVGAGGCGRVRNSGWIIIYWLTHSTFTRADG
jgi:hypothetical protein